MKYKIMHSEPKIPKTDLLQCN